MDNEQSGVLERNQVIYDTGPPLTRGNVIQPRPAENETLRKSRKKKKPYYAGIDIVKILAVFMVVCIHTYLHDGMYYDSITGTKYILPVMFRWISYTCVPLFMISTGYLMKNKKFTAKYYLKLVKIVVIYFVVSVICMKFKQKTYNMDFSDPWTVMKGFFEFSHATYAWYVNYYISLFIFIPFLNITFKALETKNKRMIFVFLVVVFTVFARSLFLGFDSTNQIRPLPNYMSSGWYLAYYFTGAYIREYPPKRNLRNKLLMLSGLVIVTCFITWSTYKQSVANIEGKQIFTSYHFNDYGSYPVYLMTLFIFLLLFDITTRNKWVKLILRQVGSATLATYLISYVFDAKYYVAFNQKYPVIYDRWLHSMEIIGKNFFYSLLCGLIIHNLYNICSVLIKKSIIRLRAYLMETDINE
ncbi:MAG: acyltransferase family protein [Ruminococcus sp.]|nr:acyltransferase family protein [Ruminococcus sp.]